MKADLYKLYQILLNRRTPISPEDLSHELECSLRTVKRYVADLRTYYEAPIETKRGQGYTLDRQAELVEISGQWFSTAALEVLLLLHLMLSRMAPESLQILTRPLVEKIELHLNRLGTTRTFPTERIRILVTHKRELKHGVLQRVVQALTEKNQVQIDYESRSTARKTTRRLSIQRMVYYRDHWYIDAWDHEREALRTFALDRVREISILNNPVRTLEDTELDLKLRAGYGIFAGTVIDTATLRFDSKIAEWVAEETWHSDQEGVQEADGSYLLKVPYSNPTELLGEILRYGNQVEVPGPKELRDQVRSELQGALAVYS